jgi:hypothetical protein
VVVSLTPLRFTIIRDEMFLISSSKWCSFQAFESIHRCIADKSMNLAPCYFRDESYLRTVGTRNSAGAAMESPSSNASSPLEFGWQKASLARPQIIERLSQCFLKGRLVFRPFSSLEEALHKAPSSRATHGARCLTRRRSISRRGSLSTRFYY